MEQDKTSASHQLSQKKTINGQQYLTAKASLELSCRSWKLLQSVVLEFNLPSLGLSSQAQFGLQKQFI
jgi:hypothetical protein